MSLMDGCSSPERDTASEGVADIFARDPNALSLSLALENLPLVYLPQTKQLVAAPGWPRGLDRRLSAVSPSHGRAACPDLPELSFPDDGAAVKSMVGSKISEDSGYPDLWDSDVSLSRDIRSERNSSVGSSDILESDLEVKDPDVAANSAPLDGAASANPRLSDSPGADNGISFTAGKIPSADSLPSPVSVSKDLQGLSVSNDSLVDGECTSCSSMPNFSNGADNPDVENPTPKFDKPKQGILASFFSGAIFGVRGRSQQDSTGIHRTSNCAAGNQADPKQEVANSRSPSNFFAFKKSDVEKSTTALILQERPKGLPLKDPGEEARHRHLYETMVEEAKQKERKDAKRQRQRMKDQLKQEALTANALKIWNSEVLPNWEHAKSSKRARELWWNGIPPRIRGRVWQLAIGNELNITSELYEICLERAKERLRILKDPVSDSDSLSSFTESTISRESSVELIRLDVSRTFPNLCIFQKGGPYHDLLQGLLASYACYRPDVGYVQGMSFIAAMLLLNMEVADAFICFANLLNKPCLLAFFRLDGSLMDAYFETFQDFFEENLPRLHQHMKERNVTPDLYLLDWLFTLYARSLLLDVVSRVWDVYFRDGEEFLFRTALGILKMYEDVLLNLDFIQLAQFLTRLPSDVLCEDLFRCIATISMEIDKRQFAQVLQQHQHQHAGVT